jgi:hypothetical protein
MYCVLFSIQSTRCCSLPSRDQRSLRCAVPAATMHMHGSCARNTAGTWCGIELQQPDLLRFGHLLCVLLPSLFFTRIFIQPMWSLLLFPLPTHVLLYACYCCYGHLDILVVGVVSHRQFSSISIKAYFNFSQSKSLSHPISHIFSSSNSCVSTYIPICLKQPIPFLFYFTWLAKSHRLS